MFPEGAVAWRLEMRPVTRSPRSSLLLGLAVGSVGVGIAIGAVIGIPAAIVSVYVRYKDAF